MFFLQKATCKFDQTSICFHNKNRTIQILCKYIAIYNIHTLFNDCICAVSGHIWTFQTLTQWSFDFGCSIHHTFIWCCDSTPASEMIGITHYVPHMKRQRKKKPTRWIFMAECRFIPLLTESNVTYALFAWADLWFIGTSVTYEVFRCLHDPLLANLCFRVKIQKWASITSAAGSIKRRVLVKCRFIKCYTLISKLLGIMLRSIQRCMWDLFSFSDFPPYSHVLWSDSQWHETKWLCWCMMIRIRSFSVLHTCHCEHC